MRYAATLILIFLAVLGASAQDRCRLIKVETAVSLDNMPSVAEELKHLRKDTSELRAMLVTSGLNMHFVSVTGDRQLRRCLIKDSAHDTTYQLRQDLRLDNAHKSFGIPAGVYMGVCDSCFTYDLIEHLLIFYKGEEYTFYSLNASLDCPLSAANGDKNILELYNLLKRQMSKARRNKSVK